jgi:hypothetical protein
MATGTVTSTQTPQYNPYQQYGVQQAYNYYNQGGTPVVPFSPQQEQAMQGISQRATNGSPVTSAGQNYITSTLNNGPFGNPYLGQLFNQGADQIQNRLSSEFAGSGRNVDQSQGVQGQALANFGSQLYGNAYNTGVQAQENALGQAVPLANQDYTDLYQLQGVGNNVQNLSQQYAQQPLTNLNQYLAQTMGNVGQASTTPYFTNTGGAALGGALLGGQFGSYLGQGSDNSSLYTLLGGAAGGLLGAYG